MFKANFGSLQIGHFIDSFAYFESLLPDPQQSAVWPLRVHTGLCIASLSCQNAIRGFSMYDVRSEEGEHGDYDMS